MIDRRPARFLWIPSLSAALLLAGCSGTAPRIGGDEEYYEAILLASSRVGWAHTIRQTIHEDGQQLIRTHNVSQLTLMREGEPVTQKMLLTCWETPDGKLVRFESEQDEGATAARGEVKDGKLTVTRTMLGKTETESHEWKGWGGFFAPTDSLWRSPMHPGDKRAVRSLTPLMNVPATTKLEALTKERIDLPDGPQELLKIRGSLTLGKTDLEMLFWVSDRGDVLRTRMPAIDQESIRVSREEALRPIERQSFDLLVDSVVKLESPPDYSQVKKAVYRAKLKSGDEIAGVFSDDYSQRVRIINGNQAEVTVLAARPDWPGDDFPVETSPDEFLPPTTFLQSDDPQVQQMASSVAEGESDPWQIAVALERRVHASIRHKDYSKAMASAAEVARQLEGDCTEHAVLLSACLKARKVPARVAFGLVYVPALSGFAYHMWSEACIQGRWIPLDATQGRGGIGCDHLKLGDSELAGADTYSDILGVVTVFRQLELSVMTTE
jgi:transglutaminase-like putative cysteine protease